MRKPTHRLKLAAAGALILIMFGLPSLVSAKTVLKMASLAPKGSRWAKVISKASKEIKSKTGGEVEVKLFAGGVMGNEAAMVRKMRTGQIQGAVITSIGLGEIDPNMLVLQMPFLFKNHKQLDFVRNKMTPTFDKLMATKGFAILSWGDVGFVYLFSNTPVATVNDVKKTKMWAWDADPITKETLKVTGVNATLLAVPDVLPSLSTGVINGFLNSPYGAIALQWHKHAKYITDMRVAVTVGAIVITDKSLKSLTPEQRKIVKDTYKKAEADLLKQVRADNAASYRSLKKKGLIAVKPQQFPEWMKLAKTVRGNLRGTLFKAALVDEMMGYLKQAP